MLAADHLGFGVECLLRGFHLFKIQNRGHPGHHFPRTHGPLQHALDPSLQILLHGALTIPLEDVALCSVAVLGYFRKHGPVGIHHRHALGVQSLHAARHQVNDPLDLPPGKDPTLPELQDHRRAGGFLPVREERTLRDHQMDAGLLNLRQLADGPGQLSLQRPPVIELLDEIGHPHAGAVEKLKPHGPPLGEPRAGHLHPEFVDPILRNQDRVGPRNLVGDLLRLQLFHHGPRVLRGEVGEEHRVVGLVRPEEEDHDPRDCAGNPHQGGDLPAHGHRHQRVLERIRFIGHDDSSPSDLHPHHLFIRRDDLVPNLHHELKRGRRLLHGDHGLV